MKVNVLFSSITAVAITVIALAYLQKPEIGEGIYTPRPENKFSQKAQSIREADAFYTRLRKSSITGKVENSEIQRVWQDLLNRPSAKAAAIGFQWEELGPDNVGGRTRAILVDRIGPTKGDLVFAGSVSGGLFRSDDEGANWAPVNLSPEQQHLRISCLYQAPNGDIYCGTGNTYESSGNTGPGGGIWKTTDFGATWSLLSSTVPTLYTNSTSIPWINVNYINGDPTNSSKIYAGTNKGLMLSSDGGTTWANHIYNNCSTTPPSSPITSPIWDMDVSPSGRVFIVVSGIPYYTDDPFSDCLRSDLTEISAIKNISMNGSKVLNRLEIAVSPDNGNYVYALLLEASFSGGIDGQLHSVHQSTDGGDTWTEIMTPIPGDGPSTGNYYFQPFSNADGNGGSFTLSGQGRYDCAMSVFPGNPGKIIFGGTQLWVWDGIQKRVAAEYVGSFSPFYVHADKHIIYFDPNDATGYSLYIGSDGGVTKSMDGANTFFPANLGYNVTQFYKMAYDHLGTVMGGTQDNGTQVINYDGSSGNGTMSAYEALGGDGFACEVSRLTHATFGTSYFASLSRSNKPDGNYSPISGGLSGPFNTIIRLWESEKDLNSKDSIRFIVDTIGAATPYAINTANGIANSFTGYITPYQTCGVIDQTSLKITAASQVLTDYDGDGNLTGDGTGTVNYSTGYVYVKFDAKPSNQIPIRAYFVANYPAGCQFTLNSVHNNLPVYYTLTSALSIGDTLMVQDPYQSVLALGASVPKTTPPYYTPYLEIARNVSEMSLTPAFMTLPVSGGSHVIAIEFSPDGDHMFVVTSTKVMRYSNMSKFVNEAADTIVTTATIYSGGSISGIAVDNNDANRLIVTHGTFGGTTDVMLLTNALTSTSTTTTSKIDVTGDLLDFPVYDAEFDITNSSIVVLATEFGVWATDNVDAIAGVKWYDENQGMYYTPVFEVRQQKTAWNAWPLGAWLNHEVFYLATHGRGLFKSSTLIGINEEPDLDEGPAEVISNMLIYPNPVTGSEATLRFMMKSQGTASLRVYDLQGRIVEDRSNIAYVKGENFVRIDKFNMEAGTYFVVLSTNQAQSVAKFMVL